MKHLILGAGPAGVIAAETLRRLAPDDEVAIVGDEREAPYSRMAIPYLLIGNIDEGGTHLRHRPGHFDALRIGLRQGRAAAVDAVAGRVRLDDGSELPYDRLLIATGSQPVAPPVPGIDLPGVHTCWTLDDARAILQLARPGARVLQMGAGFIGCIIMEALAARGVELTVVEMGDRMVPRMMGPTAGTMIRDWVEAQGVRVHTGTRVEAIETGADGGLTVQLSDGGRIDADLVISATGVRPNIGFLNGSGIACDTGVLTDDHMRTSVEGIFAAGDCAEAYDRLSGRPVVSAIQPNAAEQAVVAAKNMLGLGAVLAGVPQINVLDTLGMISTSFGNWAGVGAAGESVELTDRANGRHLSLQFAGDRLVGCNSIGWTRHVGAMRGLVEGRVALGDWKQRLLQDPTQLMVAYLACAQAQSAPAHRSAG